MAEPIKMQFGMPSQVGSGNMYYMGYRWSHWNRPTERHRIWGLGKRASFAKMDGQILTIYMSYNMFLQKQLSFWVAMIAPALKFLVGLIFNCH